MGPKQCLVCNEAKSKYKCPSCFLPYCSLACYKQHKENPCAKPSCSDKKPEETTKPTSSDGKSTAILETTQERPIYVDEPVEVLEKTQLEAIAACGEIRDALKEGGLQKLIRDIDSSANPEDDLEKAMGLDIFRVFADKVLSSSNP